MRATNPGERPCRRHGQTVAPARLLAGRLAAHRRPQAAVAYAAAVAIGVAAGATAVEIAWRKPLPLLDRLIGPLPAAGTMTFAGGRGPARPGDGGGAALETTALSLARSTLLGLEHARLTGDYRVFRALAAGGLQAAHSADDLARIFAGSRGLDLTGAASDRLAWSTPPTLMADGRLVVAGRLAAAEDRVEITLVYVMEAGAWRLLDIAIGAAGREP